MNKGCLFQVGYLDRIAAFNLVCTTRVLRYYDVLLTRLPSYVSVVHHYYQQVWSWPCSTR